MSGHGALLLLRVRTTTGNGWCPLVCGKRPLGKKCDILLFQFLIQERHVPCLLFSVSSSPFFLTRTYEREAGRLVQPA